jgi:hypothetical protein
MSNPTQLRLLRWAPLALLLATAFLSACGSGSSGGSY